MNEKDEQASRYSKEDVMKEKLRIEFPDAYSDSGASIMSKLRCVLKEKGDGGFVAKRAGRLTAN